MALIGGQRDKRVLYPAALCAVTLVCVFLFFKQILVSGEPLYGSDFVLQFRPWKTFIYNELWNNGNLPFWNPYLFSGSPFITNIQASMFYPLGFLYYLVPPEIAYSYSTMIHCALGFCFMVLFMRSLAVHWVGSFFGAIVFSFNGYFMGHLYAGHLSFMQNYIWIPVVFLFLHRFTLSRRFAAAVAAGLIVGIQILGGFPQIAFYTLLASILFILYKTVSGWNGGSGREMVILGSGLIICLLVGFFLAAVQILPTLEFSRFSTRSGGIPYAMATYESLHPKEILAFLVPELYGNAVDQTYWRSREFWHFWESCGYVGMLPLFLLFVKSTGAEKKRGSGFFVFLAALALFLALGKYNPLYPFIYRMPGFNSFRIPAQILFLYVFSVAVLSATGLGRIADGEEWSFRRGFALFACLTGGVLLTAVLSLHLFPFRFFSFLFKNFAEGPVTHADLSLLSTRMSASLDRTALFFFLSLFLLWGIKAQKLRTPLFAALACAIVFLDLYLFGAPLVKPHEFVTPDEKRRLIDQLPNSPVEGRVVTMDSLFKTNDGLEYRFPSILGYDPLILKRYAEFILSSQDLPPDEHVVNLSVIGNPHAKFLRLLHVNKEVSGGQVMNTENILPYAFLVEKAAIKGEDEIFAYLKSDAFDPMKVVVLESEPTPANITAVRQGEAFHASCEVVSYTLEEIIIKATSNRPGYLVISEVFYPGWYASVDGQRVEIQRGNFLFRVIPLDAGEHEVRIFFVSWPFRIGAVLSLVALTLSLGYLVIRKGRWRRLFQRRAAGRSKRIKTVKRVT